MIEVQKRFEKEFQERGLIFQSTELAEGTPAVLGSVDTRRMLVILQGAENRLREACVSFSIGGASDYDMQMQLNAVKLLGDLLIPEWEERNEWLLEAIDTSVGNLSAANLSTTQNGKLIKFIFRPTTTQTLFAIELQP